MSGAGGRGGFARSTRHLPRAGEAGEKNLLLLLKEYPKAITSACQEIEPYKITNYVHSLAVSINDFYTKCRVLDDADVALSKQRLALVDACRIVLKDALSLIGVSAPERMMSKEKEVSSL